MRRPALMAVTCTGAAVGAVACALNMVALQRQSMSAVSRRVVMILPGYGTCSVSSGGILHVWRGLARWDSNRGVSGAEGAARSIAPTSLSVVILFDGILKRMA